MTCSLFLRRHTDAAVPSGNDTGGDCEPAMSQVSATLLNRYRNGTEYLKWLLRWACLQRPSPNALLSVSCCELWDLAANTFNRLNAIYVEENAVGGKAGQG